MMQCRHVETVNQFSLFTTHLRALFGAVGASSNGTKTPKELPEYRKPIWLYRLLIADRML
jgi:hypothetical protein